MKDRRYNVGIVSYTAVRLEFDLDEVARSVSVYIVDISPRET